MRPFTWEIAVAKNTAVPLVGPGTVSETPVPKDALAVYNVRARAR